jgi:hypothetical protein
VVVFSNFANSNPGGLALQVADLYLNDQMVVAPKKTGDSTDKTNALPPITLSAEALETFAGNYWNNVDSYSRKIYVKDDTLRYNRGGANENPLSPIGNNTFQMLNIDVDLKVRFEGDNGNKKMVVSIGDEDPSTFDQYQAANYSPQELQQFSGAYYSDELSTAYTLVVKDGMLMATHPRHSDILLTPVKDDLFNGDAWFFGMIKFERSTSGGISGMRVSSGRVLNLYFQKQ